MIDRTDKNAGVEDSKTENHPWDSKYHHFNAHDFGFNSLKDESDAGILIGADNHDAIAGAGSETSNAADHYAMIDRTDKNAGLEDSKTENHPWDSKYHHFNAHDFGFNSLKDESDAGILIGADNHDAI